MKKIILIGLLFVTGCTTVPQKKEIVITNNDGCVTQEQLDRTLEAISNDLRIEFDAISKKIESMDKKIDKKLDKAIKDKIEEMSK